jgi:hypothetical protein
MRLHTDASKSLTKSIWTSGLGWPPERFNTEAELKVAGAAAAVLHASSQNMAFRESTDIDA